MAHRSHKKLKVGRMVSLCLSVYLFILASIPCCQVDNSKDQFLTEHSDHSHRGDESNNHCNNCSPLFTCGSCAGFLVEIKATYVQPSIMNNEEKVHPFYPDWKNDYFFKIWQPPKSS